MSGNGIRCLAQAVFASGRVSPPTLRVATLAGLRTVTVIDDVGEHTQRLQVDMGQAKVVGPEPEWVQGAARRAVRVDMGNPHLVLEWGDERLPGTDELIAIGSRIDAGTPGGSNVEIIRPGAVDGTIDMVVYERGVGPTLACGTGACAVAAAAHDWGLAGLRSTIAMPGGPVEIELGDPVLLTGDATWVADVITPDP
jgi:diaminopimelate epimerase